jgi:hypothetical protein
MLREVCHTLLTMAHSKLFFPRALAARWHVLNPLVNTSKSNRLLRRLPRSAVVVLVVATGLAACTVREPSEIADAAGTRDANADAGSDVSVLTCTKSDYLLGPDAVSLSYLSEPPQSLCPFECNETAISIDATLVSPAMLTASECMSGQWRSSRIVPTTQQIENIRTAIANFCELAPPKAPRADGRHYRMSLTVEGVTAAYEFDNHGGNPAGRWVSGNVAGLVASILKYAKTELPDAGAADAETGTQQCE